MKGFIIAGTGQCFQLQKRQLLPFHVKATLFSRQAEKPLGRSLVLHTLQVTELPPASIDLVFGGAVLLNRARNPVMAPDPPFLGLLKNLGHLPGSMWQLALPQPHLEATAKERWDLLEGLLALLCGAAP